MRISHVRYSDRIREFTGICKQTPRYVFSDTLQAGSRWGRRWQTAGASGMWRVFEDFLCVALAEALRPSGGTVRLQDRRHHLDRDRRVRLRPDLVLDGADGRALTVVDAKYKTGETPQEDLYQLLAYCTAMRLDRAYLVYASKIETHTHVVTGTEDVQIVETALDLSSPPEGLRAQITGLARRITTDTAHLRS